MAEPKGKWDWRNALAIASGVVTLMSAPWAVAIAAIIGVAAVFWSRTFGVLTDAHVQVAIEVYIVIWATYLGLMVSRRLREPRGVRILTDYEYGINPEGYQVVADENESTGGFQLMFGFRNVLSGPIRVKVERFDLRIDDRASVDLGQAY